MLGPPHTANLDRRNGWILAAGFALALVASLSIHVVMMDVLHVAFPDRSGVPLVARLINNAFSIGALVAFCRRAGERLARLPGVVSCLIVFALYAMSKEALIRAPVMDGVCTTAWIYSFVSAAPRLVSYLIVSCVAVVVSARVKRSVPLGAVSIALSAIMLYGVDPVLKAGIGRILDAITQLAHAEVYVPPYGWHVLVPAYATYAEPVLATFVVISIVWDKLSPRLSHRVAQVVVLMTLMKGALLPVLLFSPFLPLPLGRAMMSESQFTLEAVALPLVASFAWQLARRRNRGILAAST